MHRLTGRSLRSLSAFLHELYQIRNHEEFTNHLIESLPSITEGEFTSYNEFVVGSPNVIYKSDQLPYCPNPLHYAKILEDNLHEHLVVWPAAGFKDTELGVSMKPEVRHGATQVYARV